MPAPSSLTELRAALSSPGVIPAEVDALLAAIAQPPEGEEALRARADFLLSLMSLPGDASVLTGSAGTTVRTAAVEALLELGYPYALEVPPDALERARRERGSRRKKGRGRTINVPTSALVVTVITVQLQLLLLWMFGFVSFSQVNLLTLPALLGLFGPPALAVIGARKNSPGVQLLGAVGLGLQGLFWLMTVLLATGMGRHTPQVWLALPWYVPLVAGFLMRPRKQPDAPGTSTSAPQDVSP
ncbi:hypothetical protein [Myxococcus sp. Y35]|uniref:hypothetical protein n=1 Tax=Pseudomyxococcus flavus TaxID=3115648 RepID=UPI003CF81232